MTEDRVRDEEILKSFALRSEWGTSDTIPLARPDGIPLDPDRFWIVFKEANAEKIAQLSQAMAKTITREDDDGNTVNEVKWNPFKLVEALVKLQLIEDAQFPKVNEEEGTLEVKEWSQGSKHHQRRILKQLPDGLMGILHRHLTDFYFSDEEEEVVAEVKNSSEPSAGQ